MSINLDNIKEIFHNNKEVKKIEDSNGDIIWGSWDAFPYRRLEYLDFNGDQYINTGHYVSVGFYYLQCMLTTSDTAWRYIFGTNNNGFRTFFQKVENGDIGWRLKDISAASTSTTVPYNTKLELRFRNYATNNTSGRYWFAIQNLETNTQIAGQYYNNSTYAKNFNDTTQRNTISIGMNHYGNNVWGNPENRFKGRIYNFYKRSGSDATDKVMDAYPCQRKSDGVCGLYDILTNEFWPCLGTNLTTCGGPVIDEYWDLTA